MQKKKFVVCLYVRMNWVFDKYSKSSIVRSPFKSQNYTYYGRLCSSCFSKPEACNFSLFDVVFFLLGRVFHFILNWDFKANLNANQEHSAVIERLLQLTLPNSAFFVKKYSFWFILFRTYRFSPCLFISLVFFRFLGCVCSYEPRIQK